MISPIGSITLGDVTATYADGVTPGELTVKLYDSLTNIQNEVDEDIFGWVHPVPTL